MIKAIKNFFKKLSDLVEDGNEVDFVALCGHYMSEGR